MAGRGFAERLVKEALLTMQTNYIMLQKITMLGVVSGQHAFRQEKDVSNAHLSSQRVTVYLCHNLTLCLSRKLL